MIIHNIEQQSDEWFAIKELKMSASHATAIGNCGKGLDTYIRRLIRDKIVKPEPYTNKDIERGNELEQIARKAYEFEYGVTVKQVGFVQYNDYVGCSPDGLVGDDGGLELKARNDDIHLGLLMDDKVDSNAIWQMNMCMLICKRSWWDYGSFNPNFKHSLFVKRFYPDKIKFEKLLKGFELGEKMLKKAMQNEYVKIEMDNDLQHL